MHRALFGSPQRAVLSWSQVRHALRLLPSLGLAPSKPERFYAPSSCLLEALPPLGPCASARTLPSTGPGSSRSSLVRAALVLLCFSQVTAHLTSACQSGLKATLLPESKVRPFAFFSFCARCPCFVVARRPLTNSPRKRGSCRSAAAARRLLYSPISGSSAPVGVSSD